MYLISWPIDIVVYKIMRTLLPQYIQIYLLPIGIFCVGICSYICAVIVTKIADVLIDLIGFITVKLKNVR